MDEQPFVVIHPVTEWDGSLFTSIGQQFGRVAQQRIDDELVSLFTQMADPAAYWKPRNTYKGLGAKRRLYMKVRSG